MRKLIILLGIIFLLAGSVSAEIYEAPPAPETAEKLMPAESRSFSEDLFFIIKSAILLTKPNIVSAVNICTSLVALVMLTSIFQSFSGTTKQITELACTISIGIILLSPSNAMIQLGADTVHELSEYSKLLMPVLTAAMAAEGGVSGSAALYTGTVFFNTLLSAGVSKILTPMIYIFLVLCIAEGSLGNEILKDLRDFVKWLMTWCFKIILYTFTGYMGITGVVSGATDAAALKVTKLAVSGMVPVVGKIISEASESILVSAGIMKNTVGLYGFIVIFAIWIGPFLEIGIHYLLLKATAGICHVIGSKQSSGLIKSFAGATGFILAMIGGLCLMLLISIVCFLKGIN